LAGGWFHTGDIGAWDGEGRLAVVDRKKAILVLSTGKKVVPAPIEQRLAASPLIEAAMLVGDGRKYLAALLVPDFQEVDRLARQLGVTRSGADALAVPAIRAAIDAEVQRLTATLADFERPKRWAVLPRALSEEAGELTPSLKIKLRVVLEHFADDVAALYAETSPGDRPAGSL
jgi:long-chain acyl-CoA synthetase